MVITRNQAIESAEQGIRRLEAKFDQQLPDRIMKIAKALNQGDRKAAICQCHALAGEAATFGWEEVGEYAIHMRDALERPSNVKREQLIEIGLQSLTLMSKLPMKSHTEMNRQLIERFQHALTIVDQK